MRIAFLVRRFPALSETFILSQLTGLLDAGLDVEVFAATAGDDSQVHPDIARYDLIRRTRYLQPPQPRLERLAWAASLVLGGRAWRRAPVLLRSIDVRRHGRSARTSSLLYAAASFLRGEPHDVVHCQFGGLGLTAATLKGIGAVPGRIVVSFRGADLTAGKDKDAYRRVFDVADRILPVCDAFRPRLVNLGCPAEKIEVHRSGIDLGRFPYSPRRLPDGGPARLLSIARLVEKKGIAYAIEAVARLRAAGRSVTYDVAGEGPLRPELERLSRELGVADHVRFLGARAHDDVAAALAAAHILIQPSVTADRGEQEGIPNVLKEGMAMGLPVVATHHSGIPELVEDGISGFLVPERDAAALADRLVRLIDQPDCWPHMGRAGRRRVEADYDRVRLNQRLAELYRELTLAGARHV